jgi:hypothetical protein
MISLSDLPNTLRGQFIAGRHHLDIAQDWLVLHAPKMVNVTRLPWINAEIGAECQIAVHLRFMTRTEAMLFGKELGHEMDEGSSYFDIEYEHFTVHLHYVSSI